MKKWLSTLLALLMIFGTCSFLIYADGPFEEEGKPEIIAPEEVVLEEIVIPEETPAPEKILPVPEDAAYTMQEEGPEAELDPADLFRAEYCDKCGTGTVSFRYFFYGPWLSIDEIRSCGCELPHGISATHEVQQRTVDKIYGCDNCTYTFAEPYSVQEREYCNYYHHWIYN